MNPEKGLVGRKPWTERIQKAEPRVGRGDCRSGCAGRGRVETWPQQAVWVFNVTLHTSRKAAYVW